FTDNETNTHRLWGVANHAKYTKDGINDAVVLGHSAAVNRAQSGTKAAGHYRLSLASGATETILLRLSAHNLPDPFADADTVLAARRAEAGDFYDHQFNADRMTADERRVQRQAFAGLLWSKQFYYYEVEEWLEGDPAGPPPPAERKFGRN